MKFGANTFIWAAPFGTDKLPLLKKVKDMGFDSIEIPPADDRLPDFFSSEPVEPNNLIFNFTIEELEKVHGGQ